MDVLALVISCTIAFAIPLLLVAMGGMFSERSGVINIALESIMIMGALFGCLFLSAIDKNAIANGTTAQVAENAQLYVFLAVIISAVVGALFSLLLAFASINLKADQTIGGTALNMLAPAFSIVLTWSIQGSGQTAINIPSWVAITQNSLGINIFKAQGFFDTIFFKSFYLTTIVAIILFIGGTIFLYKTKVGLRLRACGEHPQAADSVGINVYKMRYLGVILSGVFAGIGGLAFVLVVGTGFQSDVSGYGFLALAVMIFGNWKPIRILFAALFFALFKTVSNMPGLIPFLPKFKDVKDASYLYLMLPYIVTMIVLAFTSKNSQAPKAEGIPYDSGKR